MSRLRARLVIGMLAAQCLGSGCYYGGRSGPVKPDTIVGDYVYRSGDRGAPHDPDRLTLSADGKYILVRMPGGHPGGTEEGTWKLVHGPDPIVMLDQADHDVEIRGKRVRLIISYARDHWYEKTE